MCNRNCIFYLHFPSILGVIVLTNIANRFRVHQIEGPEQFVMSYGGLRGAVAFALVELIDARIVPMKGMFVTATISMVYWTVFLQVRAVERQTSKLTNFIN